jgi:hypothetical protein
MIKRDLIRRYAVITTPDEMGGSAIDRRPAEFVKVNVSVNATIGEITQYGVKNEMVIHVVSNVELDDYIYTRYEYSGKMFRLVRQIKQGNEYYSTLIETDN